MEVLSGQERRSAPTSWSSQLDVHAAVICLAVVAEDSGGHVEASPVELRRDGERIRVTRVHQRTEEVIWVKK